MPTSKRHGVDPARFVGEGGVEAGEGADIDRMAEVVLQRKERKIADLPRKFDDQVNIATFVAFIARQRTE